MITQARPTNVRQTHNADFPYTSNRIAQLHFLTRYAMLAPSSHNTQPWRFATKDYKLLLLADPSRWLHAADRDGRELYISLGCALENLLIAAAHFGYGCEVEYFPYAGHKDAVARVALVPASQAPLHHPELFDAITIRQTNRRAYDSRVLSADDMRSLWACQEAEISLELRGEAAVKSAIDELVRWADERQYSRPEYRQELAYWIGQRSFGSHWAAAKIGELIVSHFNVAKAMARKDSKAVQSAPMVGLLTSMKDDRVSQVKVGQVFERIALTASASSIQLQPLSQIVEVPELRSLVRDLFGVPPKCPQHLFRLGYGETMKARSPRRRLEDVWC